MAWASQAGDAMTNVQNHGNTVTAGTSRADEKLSNISEQGDAIVDSISPTAEAMTKVGDHGDTMIAWTGQADETLNNIATQGTILRLGQAKPTGSSPKSTTKEILSLPGQTEQMRQSQASVNMEMQ